MILECALKYHRVFSLEEIKKGSVKGIEHTIDTGGSKPIKEETRQVPTTVEGFIDGEGNVEGWNYQ